MQLGLSKTRCEAGHIQAADGSRRVTRLGTGSGLGEPPQDKWHRRHLFTVSAAASLISRRRIFRSRGITSWKTCFSESPADTPSFQQIHVESHQDALLLPFPHQKPGRSLNKTHCTITQFPLWHWCKAQRGAGQTSVPCLEEEEVRALRKERIRMYRHTPGSP